MPLFFMKFPQSSVTPHFLIRATICLSQFSFIASGDMSLTTPEPVYHSPAASRTSLTLRTPENHSAHTSSSTIARPHASSQALADCQNPCDGLPLTCYGVNNGSFYSDERVVINLAENYCAGIAHAPQFWSRAFADPGGHEHRGYWFAINKLDGCAGPPKVPDVERCQDLLLRNYQSCQCNGGTGGYVELADDCVKIAYAPLYYESGPTGADVPGGTRRTGAGRWRGGTLVA
jgi:hypothetical protein